MNEALNSRDLGDFASPGIYGPILYLADFAISQRVSTPLGATCVV